MRLVADRLAGARGGRILFEGLSFVLAPGEALLVRGPNGAGKSTLLRVLAGLLRPAAGAARLEGGSLAADAHYLSTENAMKPALTVAENLRFWGDVLLAARADSHASDSVRARRPEVEPALEAVGLEHAADLPFGVLSTGQRRRVALARLFLERRALWLLDEPASGLDAASQKRLSTLMQAHLEGGGMLIAAVHEDPGVARAQAIDLGTPGETGI